MSPAKKASKRATKATTTGAATKTGKTSAKAKAPKGTKAAKAAPKARKQARKPAVADVVPVPEEVIEGEAIEIADVEYACPRCTCECCDDACPCAGSCDEACGCKACCDEGCLCESCGENCQCGHACRDDCACCAKDEAPDFGAQPTASADAEDAPALPVPEPVVHMPTEVAPPAAEESIPVEPTPDESDDPGMVTLDEEDDDAKEPDEPEPAAKVALPEAGLDAVTQFLVLANEPGWDASREKVRAGSWGAPLVGAFLMELALRGQLRIQRDRFTLADGAVNDAPLAAFVADLQKLGPVTTQVAMEKLGKTLTARLAPYKANLVNRGVATIDERKLLGLFDRSTFTVDDGTQERNVNRMSRSLAGSGTPDARAIALMGLVEASGLLESLVPSSALAFSRTRIKGLLSGSDRLGYKVDPAMKALSGLLLTTILTNVKVLCGRTR